MTTRPFTPSALDEIAAYLVNDHDTHRVLDRKFAELAITEPTPQSSPREEVFKAQGLKRGLDYHIFGPSKKDRLRFALTFQFKRSGNNGVLQLIQTLVDPITFTGNPEMFRSFCSGLNQILWFYGVEYRDDGNFHIVDPTRTLSEAEQRASALNNKMASRRIHHEVSKYCKAEYMKENYFHAVVEAYKGLAERIRELTGLTSDGIELITQSFELPPKESGRYPKLAFNTLCTETERNEHNGFLDLLKGCTRMFRNPMSHTPKIKWHREVDDAVDCLTLISLLHFTLDDCHPTMPIQT